MRAVFIKQQNHATRWFTPSFCVRSQFSPAPRTREPVYITYARARLLQ
jgi:hypothetical protein